MLIFTDPAIFYPILSYTKLSTMFVKIQYIRSCRSVYKLYRVENQREYNEYIKDIISHLYRKIGLVKKCTIWFTHHYFETFIMIQIIKNNMSSYYIYNFSNTLSDKVKLNILLVCCSPNYLYLPVILLLNFFRDYIAKYIGKNYNISMKLTDTLALIYIVYGMITVTTMIFRLIYYLNLVVLNMLTWTLCEMSPCSHCYNCLLFGLLRLCVRTIQHLTPPITHLKNLHNTNKQIWVKIPFNNHSNIHIVVKCTLWIVVELNCASKICFQCIAVMCNLKYNIIISSYYFQNSIQILIKQLQILTYYSISNYIMVVIFQRIQTIVFQLSSFKNMFKIRLHLLKFTHKFQSPSNLINICLFYIDYSCYLISIIKFIKINKR